MKFILAKIIFYINFFVKVFLSFIFLFFTKICFGRRYNVSFLNKKEKTTHFCFVIKDVLTNEIFFYKVRNPLMSMYGFLVGKSKIKENIIFDIMCNFQNDLILKNFIPHIQNINNKKVFTFLTNYQNFSVFLRSSPDELVVQKILDSVSVFVNRIHELGYIHGDIKAKNIMINKDNLDIKIVDFDDLNYFTKQGGEKEKNNILSLTNYV